MVRALLAIVLATLSFAVGPLGAPLGRVSVAAPAPGPSMARATLAAATSSWQNATATVHGTLPWQSSNAYVTALQAVLGVSIDPVDGAAQTWKFNGNRLTNLTTVEPAPGLGRVIDDLALQKPILFYDNASRIETWGYSLGNWTMLPTSLSPAAAPGTSWTAAYDQLDREAVLLLRGGFTWTLQGLNWTNISARPHGEVSGSSDSGILNLAYDSTDQVVVFFGNATRPNASATLGRAATWIFTGGNWTELCGACAPFAASPFAISDEPSVQGLLAFGSNGSAPSNATWTYAGGRWRLLGGVPSPSPRAGASLVYDVSVGFAFLIGGYAASYPWNPFAECWWWGGPSLPTFPITFHVHPAHAGALRWNGVAYLDNSSIRVTTGAYSVGPLSIGPSGWAAPPGLDYFRVVNWSSSPGLTVLGALVIVNGSGGALFLNLTPDPVVQVTATGCGPVTINGTAAPPGTKLNLPASPTPVNLSATVCTAARFDGWEVTGGLRVPNLTSPNASLIVSSNGTLAATYTELGPGPVIATFNATPNPLHLGAAVTLAITASGGAAPYRIGFTGLPPGCVSTNASELACTPVRSGDFSISVFVEDLLGASVTAHLTLRVMPAYRAPSVGAFFASSGPIVLGESTILRVFVDQGEAPYRFYFDGLPPGCTSADSGNLSCQPIATGAFLITVTIADALGERASASLVLQVGPAQDWFSRASQNPLAGVLVGAVIGLVTGVGLGWYLYSRRSRGKRADPKPRPPD